MPLKCPNGLTIFHFALCYPNGIKLNQNQNASDKDEIWLCHLSRIALEERLACQVSQNAEDGVCVLFFVLAVSVVRSPCLLSIHKKEE